MPKVAIVEVKTVDFDYDYGGTSKDVAGFISDFTEVTEEEEKILENYIRQVSLERGYNRNLYLIKQIEGLKFTTVLNKCKELKKKKEKEEAQYQANRLKREKEDAEKKRKKELKKLNELAKKFDKKVV